MPQYGVYDPNVEVVRDQLEEIGFNLSAKQTDISCELNTFVIFLSVNAENNVFHIFEDFGNKDYNFAFARRTFVQKKKYCNFGLLLEVPPGLEVMTVSYKDYYGKLHECDFDLDERYLGALDWQYLFVFLEKEEEHLYPMIDWEPDPVRQNVWNIVYTGFCDIPHYIRVKKMLGK